MGTLKYILGIVAAVGFLVVLGGCDVEVRTGGSQPSVQPYSPTTPQVLPNRPQNTCPYDTCPVSELPRSIQNYGGGSCVHASTANLLYLQGRDAEAKQHLRYAGGEGSGGLNAKLNRDGVDYAYTTTGDVSLLDWAARNRLGAGITYYPNHFITMTHLDSKWAILVDNNNPKKDIYVPRDEFIRNWKRHGGWAIVVVGTPIPPKPQL